MSDSAKGGGLAGVLAALRELPAAASDAERVDQIRALEQIKSVAAAVQAQVTAAFCASQRADQLAAGVPAERAERGIAAQVGLAKRCSPFHARRYVGWAKILTVELPETFGQLQAGVVPEWRAMLVARETAWLSRRDRAVVDAELAPQLERLGDRRTVAEARRTGYRLDPDGYLERLRNVEQDRRVWLRPAPDTMARLTALLPVAQGVAAYASLCRAADTMTAAGDARGRGQIMADTLVERLTGQASAGAVPVEVNLVMSADSLLDPTGPEGTAPAELLGYGPVPAGWARQQLLGTAHGELGGAAHGELGGADPVDARDFAPAWLRRLFTRPSDGQLVAMESRRRLFTARQQTFLRLRDLTCRMPYCDAPIRHTDHIVPVVAGGVTRLDDGQGLCAACNYGKQAPGWRQQPQPDGTIGTTTPTGHRYASRPPPLPGARRARSPVEFFFAHAARTYPAA
jgi:hypothetical protein